MISRFLQGWGQLFGGSKNAPQPKPFPGDRFFYPEELAYLSKTGEPLSQIEKWAVEAGKKAYIESFGSTARPGFNHVQWQGGIMSSYVKGLPVADNETEQVAKLKELKAQNYILPDNQLDVIRKYEARDILDRYFKTNNGEIYHVEGLETGDKEEPTLSLIKYTPDDISGKKESIDFEKFKNNILTVFHPLSSREEAAFNDRLADAGEAKIQYDMIGRTVFESPIAIKEGKIPIEQQKAYGLENGIFIPKSWEILYGGTKIVVKGQSDTNENKALTIDYMNACNYKSLLDVIYDGVNRQRDSKLSAALVETLGNKLPNGETFYKAPRSIALFHTDKGVDIDSILVDKQGELFALSSNHHVELSKDDLQKMKNSLVVNGIIEQKELEKELIVPLMKDYVDSMTMGEDIHSGNIDKLPENTRIKSLCRQEWQSEQAYNQYANHPADEDFANQYKAEWNAASLAYSLELKRLVDAYRINPGKVDLEKKARFDRLHKLLHFTPKPFNMEQDHSLDASNKVAKEEQRPANGEQVKSKKEVETHIHPTETPAADAKRESPKESLQDAEAASKQNDLKEVKNINAEEVDQKAIKSFFGNVNYAPKKVKEESSRQVAPQRLTEKEKDDAISRIDKRIAELHRLGKEQSLKSNIGNSADSHRRGYLPSGTSPDGAQSVAPSDGKDNKKFPSKYLFLGNLAHFITSFNTNIGINASNFTKELYKGIGLHPHGKDVQVSEYINFSNDKGEKTTVRLSDHRANALSIIKKGGRAAEGYSIVIKVEDSPETKFKANKHSQVKEYVYDNPDRQRLLNIGKGIFDLLDRGEYTDLANANEINISPRGRQHKELRTPDGKLLGFTYQGKIYLYPEAKGFEPPVHEYTHLWAEALQDRNWKEWKNVVGMMKKSNLWNEVRDLHTELIATDDIAEEVLATYSGRRGAERLESKLKEIVASNKSMDEKTAETQAVTQMNNAVSKFWNVMSDFLHIHYTSAEEVADRVLYEYTKGLYPLNYEEVAQQKGKTKPYYVSVEEKDNGRWHRPEVEQRAAYQRYGEMMADKLSLQLTYGDMPWIKSDKQIPCDLSKKAYHGMDSFMLALDAEKNAYTLPIYISKEDIQANNLLVKSDATFFPIIEEVGVTELYNIEQTNYPILHPKEYEDLKVDSIASNRYKQSNELSQLLRKGAWQTAIAFDGKPSLASYSAKNDTIHVAPVQHFEKEQDFYRDLGMGLTRSTRKAEARKTSFESLSKEELVSLVGSVILGQKNHFDVTTPQQTSMWKERLRKDPSYTKQVITSADVASQIIMQRIDILKKGGSQDIDLRSSTPVEVDVDGNGIVESQENLAPDQKQSSNESQEQSDEVPRQEKRHLHR